MDSNDSQLVVHYSKSKVIGLLLINVICIVCAIFLAFAKSEGTIVHIVAWIGMVLFPFALILQLRRYIRKEPLAKFDDDGVHLSSYGFIPWQDITGYAEYKSMIQVYIANEDHYINKLPAPERMVANMNKKFGFSSVTIPTACCDPAQKVLMTNAMKKRITLK